MNSLIGSLRGCSKVPPNRHLFTVYGSKFVQHGKVLYFKVAEMDITLEVGDKSPCREKSRFFVFISSPDDSSGVNKCLAEVTR